MADLPLSWAGLRAGNGQQHRPGLRLHPRQGPVQVPGQLFRYLPPDLQYEALADIYTCYFLRPVTRLGIDFQNSVAATQILSEALPPLQRSLRGQADRS